jgi:hypothetical protein
MIPAGTQTTSGTPLETAFESDLHQSLMALQSALAMAVEALAEYPRKAPDLARLLGLERNLAWKLFRLIHERDVFVAARFVPGAASIEAFVEAARKSGVAAPLLEDVTTAAQKYADVVRRHAGDRVSADIMLGVKTGEGAEVALRRAAFRSMSYVAGVQARAQLQTFICAPAAGSADRLDGVSLKGFVELTRMRPDAPVVIGKAVSTDDQGTIIKPAKDEPIDGPLPEGEFVPLIREFCSTPLPKFRRVPGEHGFVEDELVEGPVGRTGAITFMAGNVIRGLGSRYSDEHNRNMDMVTRLRTPTSVLICDVLAEESVFGSLMPRVGLYSDLFGDALRRGPGRERFSVGKSLEAEFLGKGPSAAHTSEVPRYSRLLQHVMERLPWDGARFNVYRVRIEFPFTPTSLVVGFELQEPPRS